MPGAGGCWSASTRYPQSDEALCGVTMVHVQESTSVTQWYSDTPTPAPQVMARTGGAYHLEDMGAATRAILQRAIAAGEDQGLEVPRMGVQAGVIGGHEVVQERALTSGADVGCEHPAQQVARKFHVRQAAGDVAQGDIGDVEGAGGGGRRRRIPAPRVDGVRVATAALSACCVARMACCPQRRAVGKRSCRQVRCWHGLLFTWVCRHGGPCA